MKRDIYTPSPQTGTKDASLESSGKNMKKEEEILNVGGDMYKSRRGSIYFKYILNKL